MSACSSHSDTFFCDSVWTNSETSATVGSCVLCCIGDLFNYGQATSSGSGPVVWTSGLFDGKYRRTVLHILTLGAFLARRGRQNGFRWSSRFATFSHSDLAAVPRQSLAPMYQSTVLQGCGKWPRVTSYSLRCLGYFIVCQKGSGKFSFHIRITLFRAIVRKIRERQCANSEEPRTSHQSLPSVSNFCGIGYQTRPPPMKRFKALPALWFAGSH